MIESKIKIRKRFVPDGMEILYEDRDIVVIDKSAGLLSVRADYEKENTAHRLLTTYVRKGNSKAGVNLFVVHRLDRETSGILVFAKTHEIRESFAEQWKDIEKKYLALVHGHLKEKQGIIESYLAENDEYRVRSVSRAADGKLARTRYTVIRETKKQSLLEIELLTGKKNQIRVHLSEKGHPVVGDRKYGKDSRGRLHLHALSIAFKHPYTGEEMKFETEIPECFQNLLGPGRV